ncbi:hypothetical protein [Leptothermofonsia sp. ETS-13]|uniref:hypothetical protein n=1 Tax=Leptothermofonsia sp. ETS-13 TaxID=3035696 RepID=UPI003BA2F682
MESIIAYVVASAIAYISANAPTGISLFDVAPLNGVVVGAVLYILLSKATRQ